VRVILLRGVRLLTVRGNPSDTESTMLRSKTQPATPEYTRGSVIDGKYRLIAPIGEGGMGSVWAAHSNKLDVTVAIKLIRVDTAHEDSAARLLREARVMARLADPGIVRVFDVGETEQGQPFVVMELLTGATLREVLDAGRLEAVRTVRLLLPIVRALECAHRAGVVHRDVKPDNIVLSHGARGDLQPKLLDFGAAKLVRGVEHLTRVGAVVGSPLYMSPEQARGERVDHRTDLWSVCAVLYEAVLGAPPFVAENTNAVLHAISAREVAAPAEHQELDPALWSIVRRGLTKDRENRWQNARELMLELAAWLRAQGATEDITGTALQGRGLGSFSSAPPETEAQPHALAPFTRVMAAQHGPRANIGLEAGPAAPVARMGLMPRVLGGLRGSPRLWVSVAAATFVPMLAGALLHRATERPSIPKASAVAAPEGTELDLHTGPNPAADAAALPVRDPAQGLTNAAPHAPLVTQPPSTPFAAPGVKALVAESLPAAAEPAPASASAPGTAPMDRRGLRPSARSTAPMDRRGPMPSKPRPSRTTPPSAPFKNPFE
jgi:serine/threonine-protein kinase